MSLISKRTRGNVVVDNLKRQVGGNGGNGFIRV
jgi:hypothetical protein